MTSYKKQKLNPGLTGSHLKWLALITMCIDHIGAILLETGLLPVISSAVLGGHSFEYVMTDYQFWSGVNFTLRLIGRLSFPLYCFLLTEGFLHTKDIRRYIFRLGFLALLSEVPFDFAISGTFFYPGQQNVYFTLFIGLIVLYGIQHNERRHGKLTFSAYLYIFFGMFAAYFLQSDYDAFGILLISLCYLLHFERKQLCIFGAICTAWEYSAPLAFLPIWFYNGQRGKQLPKWFFYGFYPAHLLLLAGIRALLF